MNDSHSYSSASLAQHETAESSPQEGEILLLDVLRFTRRFVAYPSEHAAIAHVLWIAHTHAMSAWDNTPRLAFLSPEPGSGKSRALEISEKLVSRPIASVSATPAYLFRIAGDLEGPRTILYDEIDTVFGPRARDNEDIRGFLNAGHRRGATAGRCVKHGNTVTTEELPAYCAVALAGIGHLPDTILTRSIVIRMRRRSNTEFIEPFRPRDRAEECCLLQERLVSWVSRELDTLCNARPTMPNGVEDRAADVWEPLLAVADAAGGGWPTWSRAAATAIVREATDTTPSLGIRLLSDLREVFGKSDALKTEVILSALLSLEEAPWNDLRGHPLDARRLGTMLREYGIQSKTIRIGAATAKGYARADLNDAWSRYLPPSC